MANLSNQHNFTIIFWLAEKENDKIYNTTVIVSKIRYIRKHKKIHLSDFERKLFSNGNKNCIFMVDGVKIDVQICFDLWFTEVSREQIPIGADILFVLANFGGETSYHISKI